MIDCDGVVVTLLQDSNVVVLQDKLPPYHCVAYRVLQIIQVYDDIAAKQSPCLSLPQSSERSVFFVLVF